jgi:peroxiredoxin
LGQLQKIESNLVELGFQIVAISPDRPENLAASVKKQRLAYTLLSDSLMEASKAFGLAYRVDAGMLQSLKRFGTDLEAASGQSHHLLPVPAVFLVRSDGRITFMYANPNYKVRLAPEVLLAAAQVDQQRK